MAHSCRNPQRNCRRRYVSLYQFRKLDRLWQPQRLSLLLQLDALAELRNDGDLARSSRERETRPRGTKRVFIATGRRIGRPECVNHLYIHVTSRLVRLLGEPHRLRGVAQHGIRSGGANPRKARERLYIVAPGGEYLGELRGRLRGPPADGEQLPAPIGRTGSGEVISELLAVGALAITLRSPSSDPAKLAASN